MSNEKLTHIVGTFLIQAEGAFLNGAGTEPYGQGDITIPKTFMTLREGRQSPVPYVSSQSWKRWLRDTFQEENPEEPKLQILTTDVNKQNNTNKVGADVDPVKFTEADIFGFMKAEKGQGKPKEVVEDEDEDNPEEKSEEESKTKGREKLNLQFVPLLSSLQFLSLYVKSVGKVLIKVLCIQKVFRQNLKKKNPDANPTSLPYNTKVL